MPNDDLQSGADTADSITADLNAAFAAAESAPADSNTVVKVDTDTGKVDAPADTRARSPDGKFAPKEATGDTKAAPDAKAAPVEAAKPAVEPLHHWPEDQKKFIRDLAALNPEMAQAAFNRLKASEDEFSRRSQELKPVKDLRDTLEPMLAKGRQQRMMRGIDDRAYVQSILAAADFLEQNPRGGLQHLAQQYGVDFAQLAQQQTQVNPEIQRLEQQIAQLQQGFQGVQAQTQQEQEAAAMAQLTSFAEAKDASGQPAHPHFNAVLNDLVLIVKAQREQGQTPDLSAAYDKAIRMNDTVWTQVQAAQESVRTAAAEEKRKAEIAEAKRAGFSVTGSGADTGSPQGASLRDELSRQFDRYAA